MWSYMYVFASFIVSQCLSGVIADQPPKLILVSMDGFRHNYLDRIPENQTANFHYFMHRGVKAKWINNVFPSVTYPSHYSLITGLYPESHGVVHNRFYDPNMDAYFNFEDLLDNYYSTWYDTGAEPIYVTNRKAGGGRRTGSLLWPTGLANVKGVSPDRLVHHEFSFTEMANKERVDTLMSWFLDKTNPINMGLLYFLEPDETGHQFGPDSEMINKKVTEMNDALGYLKKQLDDNGLVDSVNVILTSDHGMVPTSKQRLCNIDDYVDPAWYKTGSQKNNFIVLQIFPTKGMNS